MSLLLRVLPLLLVALKSGPVDSASFLRAGQVNAKDAATSLSEELAGGKGPSGEARLQVLEQALRRTFTALPKNKYGNLGHQAVRYVLHRLFVQRYGWFIRGLEPNNETWHEGPSTVLKLKEWVPSYLQELLEERLGGQGTSLRSLAVLAASLEDLVRQEAAGRLETAFEIHQLPKSAALQQEEAEDVTRTFYVSFLLANNFSASSVQEVERKKGVFARKYSGWAEAEEWLRKLELDHYTSPGNGERNWDSINSLVSKIGEQYHHFNDLECKSLKSTLISMEGRKAGRVRLSLFYKKSLHSHWRFTEKAEYLRSLGALDEADSRQPHVILPNYIMARPNCLEASNIYAICCRNECEDLMGHLEQQLSTAEATPAQIIPLVQSMASDTVQAPRELPEALVQRLQNVAALHDGLVPLHSRLFAQWMHHAYPRECPYPHEFGTTSPQTPDEWMAETGQSAASASREEMQRQVDSDTCASDAEPSSCMESPELAWSEKEELLARSDEQESKVAHVSLEESTGLKPEVLLAGAMALALAIALIIDYLRAARRRRSALKEVLSLESSLSNRCAGLRTGLALWALTCVAWGLDLLDNGVFACAMCGGFAALIAQRVCDRYLSQVGLLPKAEKCHA